MYWLPLTPTHSPTSLAHPSLPHHTPTHPPPPPHTHTHSTHTNTHFWTNPPTSKQVPTAQPMKEDKLDFSFFVTMGKNGHFDGMCISVCFKKRLIFTKSQLTNTVENVQSTFYLTQTFL